MFMGPINLLSNTPLGRFRQSGEGFRALQSTVKTKRKAVHFGFAIKQPFGH